MEDHRGSGGDSPLRFPGHPLYASKRVAEDNEKEHGIMKPIFLLVALLAAFSVFPEKSIAANTPGGFSVSPAFQEVTFDAEVSQVEFSVTLTNGTDQAVVARPTVVDFGSLDESGGVAFLGQTKDMGKKYALASWMRTEKDVLFLDGGETESLRMTIENRDALSPGGHYAAILFRIGKTEDELLAENKVAVEQLVSVLVLAKKKGGERPDLKLKEILWSQGYFQAPSDIQLRFQNDGNVHVVPRGTAVLTDPLGREVGKGIINPESGFLLPETLRAYQIDLRSLSRSIFPGKYTLTVHSRYDGRENFDTQKMERLLLPWPGILLGVFFGGTFFFLVRFRKKRLLSGIKK
jgi:hypothetical protein